MLGIGDVDFVDPSVSYNGTGSAVLRNWSRNLYTYPAIEGKTTEVAPDLATELPKISSDGLTYTVTIRKGAEWNTTPARQVTAADALLGLERSCNPARPAGASGNYIGLIQGMEDFCNKFSKVEPTAPAIAAFLQSNSISGVQVSPDDPLTITYTLVKPTSYFTSLLAMTNFAPVPQEYLKYKPASAELAQNTIADGPYMIKSYVPAQSFDFVRNPSWNADTDPIRKAYVDEIKINMTGNVNSIQQQISTNSPDADMEFGVVQPPTGEIPQLISSKDPRLVSGPTFGLDPYIVFNFKSPNNDGALKDVDVRQAISYALNRTELVQDAGGPDVSPPQTHVLPAGANGSESFDLYPYDPEKAKQLLNGRSITLKILYQAQNPTQAKMFQSMQSNLADVGIKAEGLGVPTADIYTKYLEVPETADRGVWDLAMTSWYPDWYGDNSVNYFKPLFGSKSFPPNAANFSFMANSSIDAMIKQGEEATSASDATKIWAELDKQVMALAPVYFTRTPNFFAFHSALVHNTVYLPYTRAIDQTNVWLSTS